MEQRLCLVCVLALTASLVSGRESLKIAAFNVQVFGQTKISKPEVVNILKQVRLGHNTLVTSLLPRFYIPCVTHGNSLV